MSCQTKRVRFTCPSCSIHLLWLGFAILLAPNVCGQDETIADRQALAQRRQQIVQQIGRLDAGNRHGESIPLREELIRINEQLFGSDSEQVFVDLESLAVVYEATGAVEKARKALVRRRGIAVRSVGKEHWQVAEATWKLQHLEHRLANPQFKEKFKRLLELEAGLHKLQAARDLRGVFRDSQELVRISQEVYGERPETARFLGIVGVQLGRSGNYKDGATVMARVHKIYAQTLPEIHPTALEARTNYAFMLVKLARVDDAMPHYEDVLRLTRKLHGERDIEVVRALQNLAYATERTGDLQRAREHYVVALALCEQVPNTTPRMLAVILSNLGSVEDRMGAPNSALIRFARALRVRRENGIDAEFPAVGLFSSLGNVYSSLGKYAQARASYERAAEIVTSRYGVFHPSAGKLLLNIASVQSRVGDIEASVATLNLANRVMTKVYGQQHPNTAFLYDRLVEIYIHMKAYPRAMEFAEKSLAVRKAALAENHPSLASSYETLGRVCLESGQYEQAEKHFREAIRRRELVNRQSGLVAKRNLARVLRKLGKLEAAKETLLQLLPQFAAGVGEAGPEWAGAHLELGLTYRALGQREEAAKFVERGLEYSYANARDLLPVLSEAEALLNVSQTIEVRDILLSVLREAKASPESAYAWVWRTRGLATQVVANRQRFAAKDPETQKVWTALRTVRSQLAAPSMRLTLQHAFQQLSWQI